MKIYKSKLKLKILDPTEKIQVKDALPVVAK
jgi:hypothetical protein